MLIRLLSGGAGKTRTWYSLSRRYLTLRGGRVR